MNNKKIFVLDTNVLLHSAAALESFADNEIVIPMTVLEELDKFKRNQDELGRNSRRVIRKLDQLREKAAFLPECAWIMPPSRICAVPCGWSSVMVFSLRMLI